MSPKIEGISLVMATIGRVREVERFRGSLLKQTSRHFEWIVVDQNPDDRLAPILQDAASQGLVVKHLRQKEANQSMARNLGIAHANYEVVAFPDDDCWYEPDVVEKVLHRLREPDAADGVVIRWVEQDPIGKKPHFISNIMWRQYRGVTASSICQFFRTRFVKQVDGYDSLFGLHSWYGGGEETDIMFRVLAIGARIAYNPDIMVHHAHGQYLELPLLRIFEYARCRARGTGALYARHELDLLVVLRGFIAPWYYMLVNVNKPRLVISYFGTALGRIEGFVRWKSCARQNLGNCHRPPSSGLDR